MTDHHDNEWMEKSVLAFLRFVVTVFILCVIALVVILVTTVEGAQVSDETRLAKGRIIVDALYPDSNFRPWIGTLIAEHERYGDDGFAGAWYWSIAYGGANMGLRVGATAPGLCSGPLDVKSTSLSMHRRMRTDTRAHLKHHVAEMWRGYQKGYRGRGLCEYTFLPSHPRDWGGGRFRRTDAAHRDVIAKAWRLGTLTEDQAR